jgi:hypothetical protein
LAQAYFEGIGTLLIEHRESFATLERATLQHSPGVEYRTIELPQDVSGLQMRLSQLQNDYDQIVHSTSWRIAAPLRRFLDGQPTIRRFARRVTKAGWWTVTGQLPRRLRERRDAMQSGISEQPASAAHTQV